MRNARTAWSGLLGCALHAHVHPSVDSARHCKLHNSPAYIIALGGIKDPKPDNRQYKKYHETKLQNYDLPQIVLLRQKCHASIDINAVIITTSSQDAKSNTKASDNDSEEKDGNRSKNTAAQTGKETAEEECRRFCLALRLDLMANDRLRHT